MLPPIQRYIPINWSSDSRYQYDLHHELPLPKKDVPISLDELEILLALKEVNSILYFRAHIINKLQRVVFKSSVMGIVSMEVSVGPE